MGYYDLLNLEKSNNSTNNVNNDKKHSEKGIIIENENDHI